MLKVTPELGANTVMPRQPAAAVAGWLEALVAWLPGSISLFRAGAAQLMFINLLPIIVIWTLSASHLVTTHGEMARAAERETSRIALTLEQNVRRTVSEVDRTLRYIRELHGQLGESQPWASILQKQFVASQMVAQVAAIDRNGFLISSSHLLEPPAPLDLSDRQHVRVHIVDPSDKLFISVPVQGRVSGKWTIQFTRPFYDAARAFAGVIVLSLNVDYLATTYADLDLDDQSGIALLGRDKIIRAGRGPFAADFGKAIPDAVLQAAETGVPPGITPLGTLMGNEPLTVTVLRDLADVPLRILFQNRSAAAEDLWQSNARFNIFASIALSISSLVLTSMFVRRRLSYEKRLHELAYYDSLTALPNRRSFLQSLLRRCKQAKAEPAANDPANGEDEVILLLVGIDRMKQINDRQGQTAGDIVLNQCGERLAEHFNDGKTLVGRFAGDEFAILAEADGAHELEAMCQTILSMLRVPIEFERQRLMVDCSIGAVKMRLDPESRATLLHAATYALQEAKRRGGGTYQLFDGALNTRIERANHIEAALTVALEQGALDVHYQPVVCARSHQRIGYEALVRWKGADGVFISPGEFVPIAEARGLIGDLDRFVIERVFSQAHRLIERPEMAISINLSARELHNGQMTAFLQQCLARHHVNPANIRIEITETAILDNLDSAVMQLQHIKDMGFQILLDDFGTCYSSLSYLMVFPVSGIKIDRSFVHGITEDARDGVIISAIVHIGRGLGLKVVAEGVEEKAEATILAEMGVDYLQGYFFGRPAPIETFCIQAVA